MAISLESATQLNMDLVRVIKLFHSMRQHAPKVHPGVEPASRSLLGASRPRLTRSLSPFRRSSSR